MLSWTKASERYVSFFNQEKGIGIFGFAVLAKFRLVFWLLFQKTLVFSFYPFWFVDFMQFSI